MISCTDDGETAEYPQRWQLIKMTGQLAGSETIGSDMAWQEFYFLNSDGTFIKSREQDGVIREGYGKFLFEDLSDGKYLILTYETYNEIIGNCTPDLKEVLALKSYNRLVGTWSACDGPGLLYERFE